MPDGEEQEAWNWALDAQPHLCRGYIRIRDLHYHRGRDLHRAAELAMPFRDKILEAWKMNHG